jgi:hypothetical protein
MSVQSTALSKAEKKRNRASTPSRLLYTREQAADLLGGVSVHTIRRLEAQGRLRRVRLTKSPSAMVFIPAEDVHALVDGAAGAP